MNGEATSVAIIVLPLGRSSISGAEIKVYISAAKGTPIIDKIANKKILYGAKPKLPIHPKKKLMRK